MASSAGPGAGLGDGDRRALKQGKKLLKGVFGAATKAVLGKKAVKKGKKLEKQLRRAAQAARDAQGATAAAAARVAAARQAAEAEHAGAASSRRAAEAKRAAAASSRAEAEADFKSLAAEWALAAQAAEELGAERRRRGAAERELDAAWEAAQSHAGVVEAVLADAQDVAARAQEFYETERGEREAAQRTERELRDQLRAMERELAALEGGGFEDASGLFGGVSGSVAARARGAALRAAKQELERRRADAAVSAAAAAARERAFSDELAAARADAEAALTRDTTAHVDAARADAAARTAAADAARRERDAAAACLAAERETSAAAKQDAERQRARWYEASFELQAAEKHAQNTLDLKNRALEEQAARSAAYWEEVKGERELKSMLQTWGGLAEAKIKGTEAELGRLKADLEQAQSTAAAQRSRAEEAEAAREETQRLRDQLRDATLDEVMRARASDKKLTLQYAAEATAARDVELGQASLRGRLTQAELERTRALLRAEQEKNNKTKADLEQASAPRPAKKLSADFNKLDKAVSSSLASIAKAVNDVPRPRHINNNGHAIDYAKDDIRKKSEDIMKVMGQFRQRVRTLDAPTPAQPPAPMNDEDARVRGVEELLADLNKLDKAVSSLLTNKNELKQEVWRALSRAMANNNGHPIEHAMKAVEQDFEDMCKVIQEFRAHVRTEAALRAGLNKLDEVVPSLLGNINEVKKYMPFYDARPAGYPSKYALDDVEKDFRIMCKVVQEFRVHTLNASGSTAAAPVGLRVADVDDNGVELEWYSAEDEDHPASGFDVQYKLFDQVQWEDVNVASQQRVPPPLHKCKQKLYLVRGMRYCFRVRVAAPGIKPTSPWSRSVDATQRSWVEAADQALDASGAPPHWLRSRARTPQSDGGCSYSGPCGCFWLTTDGELRGPTTLGEYEQAHAAGITNMGPKEREKVKSALVKSSSRPSASEASALGAWRCSCTNVNYTGATECWVCGHERPAGAGPMATAFPCGLWVVDVDDHAVELEWCRGVENPEKGFDVQYKLYDQTQWENANVTLFTITPAPSYTWRRVPGVPCLRRRRELCSPVTSLRRRHGGGLTGLPTGARR